MIQTYAVKGDVYEFIRMFYDEGGSERMLEIVGEKAYQFLFIFP